MPNDMITLQTEVPLEVYAALAALARSAGRPLPEVAGALLVGALVPSEVPDDADATLLAAAREFLADRLDNVAALIRDVDARLLLGVSLRLLNSMGLARHDGDREAWDEELRQGLQNLARGDLP